MQFPYVQCDTFGEKEMFKPLKAPSYQWLCWNAVLARPCYNINFYIPSCFLSHLQLHLYYMLFFFFGGGGGVLISFWFSNYSWEIYEILATYWFYYEWLSVVKRCESVNTMASFLWWIVGFYWVVSGGDTLLRDAPRLYWYALTTLECPLFISICYMLYYFEIRARAHTHTHIYSFPFLLLPSCKVGRGRSL